MMEHNHPINREIFIDNVRDALKNLYNYDFLRSSPLAKVFNIHDRFDTARVLQETLIAGINDFKPPANEPDQSRAWRIFDSLFCCFVQQLKQEIVADQLSISPRQLRREQRHALESLSDFLWQKFNLDAQPTSNFPTEKAVENPNLAKELGWVQDLPPSKPTLLQAELPAVLGVTRPLCQSKNVQIDNSVPANLPPLAIHSVVLSQILVNLVIAAVNRAQNGPVQITATPTNWMIEVCIETPYRAEHTEPGSNVAIATELAKMSAVQIEIGKNSQGMFYSRLLLPIQEQIPVLLVDDNEDALELFARYTMGSRYRLTATQNPAEILSLVEKIAPEMIILDIMMPENNGWMLLGMLKNHPLTSHIPVIICTILPQEELAFSLGANGFINKPINRQDFLAALNQMSFSAVGPTDY